MRSLRIAPLLLALVLPATAAAGTFPEEVEAAKGAIAGADSKAALDALDAAEAAAGSLAEVVDAKTLATYWFYRGVATWMKTGSVDKAGDYWRYSLVVDNGYEWDEELAKDRQAQDYYLALSAEVRARPRVDPGVPAATGEARVYVDGIRVRAGDLALEGQHLAQIRCPDLAVFGQWSDFGKPIKYLKLCPGGVDTSVVVAEVAEDDFGDMGPAFGGGEEAPAGPPPDPEQDVVDTIARGAGLTADAGGGEGGEVEVIRKKVIWPAFAAGVAAAGAAGALQLVAMNKAAQYNDLENPDYQTADDLAKLRKSTNLTQTLVYPALVVSGGLLFVATYQW
jgi:hypothetical protein